MSIVLEKELIQAIKDALPGVNVVWGFAEFESAKDPPSFPLVAVTRVNAGLTTRGGLLDMCDADDETADIILQADSWQPGYENARNLNEQVHAIIASLEGWSWQSDVDMRDPQIKAWRVTSTWLGMGDR
jgi:hypothetical protein